MSSCVALCGGLPQWPFLFKSSIGTCGGIITVWDPTVLDVLLTVNIANNNELFCLANIYAPCDNEGRQDMWDAL